MVKWRWKIDCCHQENSPDGLLERVDGEVYMKRRLGSGRRRERVSEETATGKALDKATKTRIDALRDAPPNGWAAFSADESRRCVAQRIDPSLGCLIQRFSGC